MEQIVIGILAHVDAGKTTLAEAMLFHSGRIRKQGRVDHGDAYLDTDAMERERGITIFSKQAVFTRGERRYTLLDTPGHVDFSAEMERTLSVLDYAILVVSAADGVQGHTETLWQLLRRRRIPTLLFVNKMDQPGAEEAQLMAMLRGRLSGSAVAYDGSPEMLESLALCEEAVMERYLETGEIGQETRRRLFRKRKFFPVFFGSALRDIGVERFLREMDALCIAGEERESLSGRVYKIGRGENGQRLTFLRLTGGMLRNREELVSGEKVTQIRIYSGERFEEAMQISAGQVAAVLGISSLRAGDGFGEEAAAEEAALRPVLDYRVLPEEGETVDEQRLYRLLSGLADEFPDLHLHFDTALREIHAELMGEVQTEVLRRIAADRLGVRIRFGSGRILYRETVAAPAVGIGHFEPLRHYAEVHVLLEPLPRNAGLQIVSNCPPELLGQSWQRQILKELREKEHRGVLTGAPITDMRLTLLAGRAHLRHTEGGDFREASMRAVRQGLRRAQSLLLEPCYRFTLELPAEQLGRVMTDITNRAGCFEPPEGTAEWAVLHGTAPVATMRDYAKELRICTRGRGRLRLEFSGYESCHNSEEVIAAAQYDPDADTENPCSSVFCAHGAGFLVPYDEVEEYAQVFSAYEEQQALAARGVSLREELRREKRQEDTAYTESGYYIGDRELERIFVRTYGEIRNRAALVSASDARTVYAREREENLRRAQEERRERSFRDRDGRAKHRDYLLVDGYNIIFAWQELRELAEQNLDAARGRLLDILSNYQGYMGMELIVVFDAYRVQGHPVERTRFHNIHVVFTREAQTADHYIEELTQSLSRTSRGIVRVATSDRVVRVIVWGNENVVLLSAEELEREVERAEREIRTEHLSKQSVPGKRLEGGISIPEARQDVTGQPDRQGGAPEGGKPV